MICPVFRKPSEDYCIRDGCLYYSFDKGVCIYEEMQNKKKADRLRDKEKINKSSMIRFLIFAINMFPYSQLL